MPAIHHISQRVPYQLYSGVAESLKPASKKSEKSDQVRFSSVGASHITDAQRLQATIKEATDFFMKYRNSSKEELLRGFAKEYQGQAELFDGSKPGLDWVNKVCSPETALHHIPESILYPNRYPNPNFPPPFPDKLKEFPRIYTEQILPRLFREKKPAIFVSNSLLAKKATVVHEIFHFLQMKNGLPFSTTYEADMKALEYNNSYNKPLFPLSAGEQNGLINRFILNPLKFTANDLWHSLKVLSSWSVYIPYLKLKSFVRGKSAQHENSKRVFEKFHAASRCKERGAQNRSLHVVNEDSSTAATQQMPTKETFQTPSKPTPGDALRTLMAREKEVDRYIIFHGGEIGLSLIDRIMHIAHFIGESKFKDLLSIKFDF